MMKPNFVFAFVFLTIIAHAQKDTSIVGKWKITSIEFDGIYYNIKKDSLHLSNENTLAYADSTKRERLREATVSVYSAIRFHFDEDKSFKQSMNGRIIYEGSYRFGAAKNFLEIITKNSFNEDVAEKAEYHIRNGLLHLSMRWDDDEFNFVLEKE